MSGFLRADGSKLVNGDGREVLLRGVGFGSWLLPEGYMWRFPQQGDRPRRIERLIEELVGKEKAADFWETYYDRYIAEADILKIAEEGFNSVRVPINARFLMADDDPARYIEKHWLLLDRVIAWCREHRLYVILDLHGAPGGQTGTNIDDSENDVPELFTDERNRRLTVELWRKLAQRYRDEWIVAGYDLLNEPLPDWFAEYNDRVMPLYRDIVKAIREVDRRHLIILEGAHWSTDWSIFGGGELDGFDDNVMLQFHKYWNNPDTESIGKYIGKRDEWNVPIFMGEGGENNKDWYAGAFRLFEDHGISWNFWTWKKLDTDNSPCSIRMPEGWSLLVSYLEGGDKPDAETAERILWAYLDGLPLERCDYHPDVVHALFRRAPVRIPAVFYGYRGEGISFGFGDRAEGVRRMDRDARDRNGRLAGGFRENDGTMIPFVDGNRTSPNFQHGRGEPWQADEWLCVQLEDGDWLAYDFELASACPVDVTVRLSASRGQGKLAVLLDGASLSCSSACDPGRVEWENATFGGTDTVSADLHRITVAAQGGPVRVQWLHVTPSAALND